MGTYTAHEQLLLELVNRARLDPWVEAARLGIDLNQGLAAGTLDGTAKQALAPNQLLHDAAETHSLWMLAADVFSHTGAGGSDPGDRMAAAGYVFSGSWTWGENIAWGGTTGVLDPIAGVHARHDSLFRSAGHRVNILEDAFREVGLAAETGQFTSGSTYNALMVTQKFATSGSGFFVTGVHYADTDANSFYSVGEGLGGRTVSVSKAGMATLYSATAATGGYAVKTQGTGTYDVAFSGGGLASPIGVSVFTSGDNVKVDLIGAGAIESSASTTLGSGAVSLELLGVDALTGTGNALANLIMGNRVGNVLSGLDGADTLLGLAGADSLIGGAGVDVLDGGLDNDTLSAGDGADYLYAYYGSDVVDGGAGDDVVFTIAGTQGALQGGAGIDAYWQIDWGATGRNIAVGATPGLTLAGFEANVILLAEGADTVVGSAITDHLYGYGGADVINGGAGFDVIVPGAGNDAASGGAGSDYMLSGTGADSWHFNWSGEVAAGDFDVIANFRNAVGAEGDWIVLPLAYQGLTTMVDYAGFGVIITLAVGGGWYGLGLTGITAALAADQIVYA